MHMDTAQFLKVEDMKGQSTIEDDIDAAEEAIGTEEEEEAASEEAEEEEEGSNSL
jgi:hypothetical protein